MQEQAAWGWETLPQHLLSIARDTRERHEESVTNDDANAEHAPADITH